MRRLRIGAFMVDVIFSAPPNTAKKKGRELVAPPQEAPRSAHPENAPSRARLGASLGLASGFENSRFSCEAVAEATLNCFESFCSTLFRVIV